MTKFSLTCMMEPSKPKFMSKKFLYEKAIKELNDIVKAIQSEEVGLDDLSDMIKKANELIAQCKEKLRTVEGQIEEITED